jgi:hypothetical protein
MTPRPPGNGLQQPKHPGRSSAPTRPTPEYRFGVVERATGCCGRLLDEAEDSSDPAIFAGIGDERDLSNDSVAASASASGAFQRLSLLRLRGNVRLRRSI